MQPTCIHCLTTHTSVWFTGFRAQPVGHCYPDGLVLLLLCIAYIAMLPIAMQQH